MEKNENVENNCILVLLQEGIESLLSYMEEICRREVFVAGVGGDFLAGSRKGSSLWKHLKNFPALASGQYYYHRQKKLLAYAIEQGGEGIILCFMETGQLEIEPLLQLASRGQQAFLTYLDLQRQAKEQAQAMERTLVANLMESSASIHDIIGFHKIRLHASLEYAICLFSLHQESSDICLDQLMTSEICHLPGREILSLWWQGKLLVILPVDENFSLVQAEHATALWRDTLEMRLGRRVFSALGRAYGISQLHRSYLEARIAMAFLEEAEEALQLSFFRLGFFETIFSQELAELKEYVNHTLGTMIRYDRDMQMQLVPTLRILLKTDFNWARTAEQMYAHVNTIHYRYEKIRRMMRLDLSAGEGQAEAFAALKVWDVLVRAGLMKPGGEGSD